MKNTKRISAIACMLALTGCATPYSEVPVAKNFPTTAQEKLQAAAHWTLIANDLSKRIQTGITGKIDKEQALYVSSKDASAFNQAVVAELISSLVNDGYLVVKAPENTIKVDVDTQVLEFSPNRLQEQKVGIPTAIATGLWAASEIGPITGAGVVTGIIAGSEALTYMNADRASGATPKSEVVVNASVSDATHYITVSRATYYVSDTDKWLYQAAQTKAFNVQGNR